MLKGHLNVQIFRTIWRKDVFWLLSKIQKLIAQNFLNGFF
jgi:hypothetical protein